MKFQSKDKTLSIIDRYKDHIAKVTSEPDKGLYDAMNKGIRLATGDYLCFLNAGDSFHEDDTLQQMVHTLPGSELPDVMYGETALVDKEGHFVRMRRLSAPETLTWKSFRQGAAQPPGQLPQHTVTIGSIFRQRMVFNCNLIFIKIFMEEISPSPLSVISILPITNLGFFLKPETINALSVGALI